MMLPSKIFVFIVAKLVLLYYNIMTGKHIPQYHPSLFTTRVYRTYKLNPYHVYVHKSFKGSSERHERVYIDMDEASSGIGSCAWANVGY